MYDIFWLRGISTDNPELHCSRASQACFLFVCLFLSAPMASAATCIVSAGISARSQLRRPPGQHTLCCLQAVKSFTLQAVEDAKEGRQQPQHPIYASDLERFRASLFASARGADATSASADTSSVFYRGISHDMSFYCRADTASLSAQASSPFLYDHQHLFAFTGGVGATSAPAHASSPI